MIVLITAVVLIGILIGLGVWRLLDERRVSNAWQDLLCSREDSPAAFHTSMVANLPKPAQRYFLFTIGPGTLLRTVSELRMRGRIGLGTRDRPNYLPMRCRQILAPPHGFIWTVRAGAGAMRVSGSDGFHGGRSWSTFWWLGVVPVARAGDADHARSAFGRLVAESVFWAPSALLPQAGVVWESVSEDVARATVKAGAHTQTVDIKVDDEGRPVEVVIPRWSNANPTKTYRYQPFGGYLADFREFGGYRLPSRVEGGNFFGTQDFFPFYEATVEDIRFIANEGIERRS